MLGGLAVRENILLLQLRVGILFALFLTVALKASGRNAGMHKPNASGPSLIAYPLLGISLAGAFWFNFFAAMGEYFYHSNFKSPPWMRYLIQTPELHSVHHELDVHRYNFSDLPLWDRLFGTYKDTTTFAPACGFPRDNERHLAAMLLFKDVYNRP